MRRINNWYKLLAGLVIVAGITLFFMSGYAPPGKTGEVLRHNQTNDIDASPLFYSEVEHMAELEQGVAAMRDSVQSDSLTGKVDSALKKEDVASDSLSPKAAGCTAAKTCPISSSCE